MVRTAFIAALLSSFAASAASAETVGPPIAYAKVAGSTLEIYLANPNGTGTVRIYRAPAKTGLGFMDIRPGGGKIAFAQSTTGLNILSYNAAGVASLPAQRVDEGCFVEGIDWSADGTKILYSASCNQVSKIKVYTVGGSSQPILDDYFTSVRWGRDGDSIFYLKTRVGVRDLVWRQLSTGREVVLYPGTQTGFSSFDVGRTTNSILLADGQANIYKIDFQAAFPAEGETPSVNVTQVERGTSPHFSPNDLEFLYETPHSARGDYYLINAQNGADTRVTVKGDYGQSDWAPPAQ